MEVDPAQLRAAASKLADHARGTLGALPKSWLQHAGADPISAGSVPHVNNKHADAMNGMSGTLNDIHRLAHEIGASAKDYSAADDEDARTVNGRGGEVLDNPVPPPGDGPGRWEPPTFSMPAADAPGDPLTYAKQLRAGPGTGPAQGFSADIGDYLTNSHPQMIDGIDDAVQALQHWTPVGSEAAGHLNRHRNRLQQHGSDLHNVKDMVDTYTGAFDTAKAKHPTPSEIMSARKELLKAARSKNELGVQHALAKMEEHNARSTEAMTGYSSSVNGKNAANGSGAGNSSGSGDSSGDSSALMQMLPSLLSSMGTSAAEMGSQQGDEASSDAAAEEDLGGYGDPGYGALGSPAAAGGGDTASMPSAADVSGAAAPASGAMSAPAAGLSGAGASAAPAEPARGAGSPSGAAGARAGGGSPMPYMPMSPGMAGAGGANSGGNERNRVVAWHPDRLMYVDNTPHTEQVIGEKPTIAPTVTPPTPGSAGQDQMRAGGST